MMHHRQLVNIDLKENSVSILVGHLPESRLNHAARSAPGRREVDHHLSSREETKQHPGYNQPRSKDTIDESIDQLKKSVNDLGLFTSLLVWEWACQFWVHSPSEWTATTADSPSS